MENFHFKTISFSDFTTNELYAILQLRSEVFVVEQDCVYQDIDYKDQKSYHLLGFSNNELVCYARIFNEGDYFDTPSIGRVIVKETFRDKALGHVLMKEAVAFSTSTFQNKTITISAQQHLEKFYNQHGFIAIGTSYLEDGIPHIKMIRN